MGDKEMWGPAPATEIPANPEADAKDRLRDAGIVTGPDRYGNWFVPCGDRYLHEWRPGDPITDRVMVRNNGAIGGSPMETMRWGWAEGRWVENVTGISEDDVQPVGEALPFIY